MWDKWSEVNKLPLEESSTKGFKPVPVSEEEIAEINEGEYGEAFPTSLEAEERGQKESDNSPRHGGSRHAEYSSDQIDTLVVQIQAVLDSGNNEKTIQELSKERGISRSTFNRRRDVLFPDRDFRTKYYTLNRRGSESLTAAVTQIQKELDADSDLKVGEVCEKHGVASGNFYYKRKSLWPDRFGEPYARSAKKKLGRPLGKKVKEPRYIDLEITPEAEEDEPVKLVAKEKLFSFQGTKAELIKFCTLVLDLESAR